MAWFVRRKAVSGGGFATALRLKKNIQKNRFTEFNLILALHLIVEVYNLIVEVYKIRFDLKSERLSDRFCQLRFHKIGQVDR
jgi:hypothetical protein